MILACVWICGLLSGTFLSLSAGDTLFSTMRAAVYCGMSISGLLCVLFLPLLFTVLAVYISRPLLLLPVAFLKAFLFSFSGTGIFTALHVSGWLFWCFLMFSDILTLPFLWLVWLDSLSDDHKAVFGRCMLSMFAALLIGCFDYAFVAPFLARLISYGKG